MALSRYFVLFALIFAGEQVFGLAFHTGRFFRATMLDVFGFSNTELGDLTAIYGITAMLAYFPGGVLADRYPARTLMIVSLLATAAGGVYMASLPGYAGMGLLYGYWGVTTILLFWAAMIKATRDWGGTQTQGGAFGLLEGGRGLVAVLVGFAGVALFEQLLPTEIGGTSLEERREAFRFVIWWYTGATVVAAVLVALAVPKRPAEAAAFRPLDGMRLVLRQPLVWATAGIVLCAYCGYKGIDNYTVYAVDVLHLDQVAASKLFAWGAVTRPLAAIAAGLIADRFGAARSLLVLFAAMGLAFGAWSVASPGVSGLAVIYANFFITYAAVFAMRGVYFALLGENATPFRLTGASVGLISLVGFLPEIFFGPVSGRILDANPGVVGFQHYFLFLAAVAVLGFAFVLLVLYLRRGGAGGLWQHVPPRPK